MGLLSFIREESNFKLLVAAAVIGGVSYVVFYNPYDKEYYTEVERELGLARLICENSEEWVLSNEEHLKMDDNTLDRIRVNGQLIKLEHVKYPKAVLLHDGFHHPNAQIEFYCTFEDPRGNTGREFFYDYHRHTRVDKTISRR